MVSLYDLAREHHTEPVPLGFCSIEGFEDAFVLFDRYTAVFYGESEAITILFAADGSYSGSAGCNVYQGTYTLAPEGGLELSPPAATKQLCGTPEGVMEQETAYLNLLPGVTRYEVNDAGQLILYTSDKWQLVYQQLATVHPQ